MILSHKPTPSRPPETITPPRIDFLGEQTGPVEDNIQARFCQMFAEIPTVRSAYLARISLGEPSGYSVGLCVRSTAGVDQSLQERLGQVFAETFAQDQHLDILFIRDDQEQELRKVCRPFYEAE